MLILGIDTGGTYTDGVIIDKNDNAILAKVKVPTIKENIIESIESCISSFESKFDLAKVELVSLSTTLATNAIVEGKNLNAGLILIGDVPDEKLPTDDYIYVNGKFNIKGESITPLNETSLIKELNKIKGKYEAIAISGYASVRNPIHEQRAKEITKEILGIPVVCGHELTGALGFQERTVTALLNAGIIHLIQVLIDAVESTMAKYKIKTPLMIVKGDGTLMEANYAKERPIETILSGPAASIMGAVFLSDINDGMIVDIGGTTTDITSLQNDSVAISKHGATVGGWQTRVRSLKIHTYGLGGDSKISLNNDSLQVGPQRAKPYCKEEGSDEKGLTPTDILHILGEYDKWDVQGAIKGLEFETKNINNPKLTHPNNIKKSVVEAFDEAIEDAAAKLDYNLNQGLVGVGAPAHVWVNEVGQQAKINTEVPLHAEVANAIGAAVGQVTEISEAIIRFDESSDTYIAYFENRRAEFSDFKTAIKDTKDTVQQLALEKADYAGAIDPQVSLKENEILSEGVFIEYQLKATANGSPKISFK